MTGQWESALNKIAIGDMDADTFHRGIEVYAHRLPRNCSTVKLREAITVKVAHVRNARAS